MSTPFPLPSTLQGENEPVFAGAGLNAGSSVIVTGTSAKWNPNNLVISRDKNVAYDKDYSLKTVSQGNSTDHYAESAPVAVSASTKYVASAYVLNPGTFPGQLEVTKGVSIQIIQKDGSGNIVGSTIEKSLNKHSTEGWERLYISFTTHASAATALIRLYVYDAGTVWWDAASFSTTSADYDTSYSEGAKGNGYHYSNPTERHGISVRETGELYTDLSKYNLWNTLRVQHVFKKKTTFPTSDISINWKKPTTAGNFLIAFVAVRLSSGTPSVSATVGWTADHAASNGSTKLQSFFIPNSASRSGVETFTISGGTPTLAAVTIIEYSGMLASPIDVAANSVSTTTSPNIGVGAQLVQNGEIVVAGVFADANGVTLSDPTKSFRPFVENSSTLCFYGFELMSNDIFNNGGAVTASSSQTFFVVSYALKAKPGHTPNWGTTMVGWFRPGWKSSEKSNSVIHGVMALSSKNNKVVSLKTTATNPFDWIVDYNGTNRIVEKSSSKSHVEQDPIFAAITIGGATDNTLLTRSYMSIGKTEPYIYEITVDNPVAWWRLGETSGNVLNELDNSLYILTKDSGTPVYEQSGAIYDDSNKSIRLDATTRFKSSAFISQLNTNTFTVELFVYIDGLNSNRRVFSTTNGTTDGYEINISNAKANFITGNGASRNTLTSVQDLELDKWYHLVCLYDGTTAKLYINGLLDNSQVVTFVTSTTITTIGQTASSFVGKVDEISYYNTALSEARIKVHYAASQSLYWTKNTSTLNGNSTITNEDLKFYVGCAPETTFSTPALVQSGFTDAITGTNTSVVGAWTSQTTEKNLLVATIGIFHGPGGMDKNKKYDIVPRQGPWKPLTRTITETNNILIRAFYIENASSRSGNESFTLMVDGIPNITNGDFVLSLTEWSNVSLSGAKDRLAEINSGPFSPSTTHNTGTTATSTQTHELFLGAVFGSADYSAPTNGFTLLESTGTKRLGLLYKTSTSYETASSALTSSDSVTYAGFMATLRAKPAVNVLDGYVDGAMIFNRVLTEDELKEMARNGFSFDHDAQVILDFEQLGARINGIVTSELSSTVQDSIYLTEDTSENLLTWSTEVY